MHVSLFVCVCVCVCLCLCAYMHESHCMCTCVHIYTCVVMCIYILADQWWLLLVRVPVCVRSAAVPSRKAKNRLHEKAGHSHWANGGAGCAVCQATQEAQNTARDSPQGQNEALQEWDPDDWREAHVPFLEQGGPRLLQRELEHRPSSGFPQIRHVDDFWGIWQVHKVSYVMKIVAVSVPAWAPLTFIVDWFLMFSISEN